MFRKLRNNLKIVRSLRTISNCFFLFLGSIIAVSLTNVRMIWTKPIEDGEFKVSTRSKELVDLSEIAVKFDGGGHVRAAGFSMKGEPEQIIEAILEEVKKQL